MYEGQIIICQNIIEENWLEYLSYVKKKSDEDIERQKKRQAALAEFDQPERSALAIATEKVALDYDHRYYDLGLNGFWNWYIQHKI